MTELTKPVTRVTRDRYAVLHVSEERQIVCTMLVGDVLEFREKGKQGRWTVAISDAFRQAVKAKAFAEINEKRVKRAFKPSRSKL